MNTQLFEMLLKELHQESSEVQASALVSEDGMMLASHLPKGVSEDRLAAMSAAILSLGDRMIDDLSGGVTDRVMIQTNMGYVIVTAVSDDLVLTVSTAADAQLGMIFHDVKNFAKQLQGVNYRL